MVHVAIALVTLLSALAVLGSNLLDPNYRLHFRDALWFVLAYTAVQVAAVHTFARDTWLVPWFALAKTAAAYLFLATFVVIGRFWMVWTPGRYVYQLFDWGEGAKIGLYAMVFLGRGAFNTLSAFVFTSGWWLPLRARYPLAGRAVTALPIAIAVFCMWAFTEMVRLDAASFSAEAHDVARRVFDDLACAEITARSGETTTDLRQQGERRFVVRISFGCAETRVVVQAEDGKLGTAGGPRHECCVTHS
jgi:acyl-CoA synthetase (AMP-forming)/AMP-acid ligase II